MLQLDDGKFTKYLMDETFKNCDLQLWEELGKIVSSGTRAIHSLQTEQILKAEFYNAPMDFSAATSDERKKGTLSLAPNRFNAVITL